MTEPIGENLSDKFKDLYNTLRGSRSADVVTALKDEIAQQAIAELMASEFKNQLAGAIGIELEAKLRAEVGPGLTEIKEAVNLKGDATVNAVNTKADEIIAAVNTKGDATVNAVGSVETTLNETIYPAIQELQSVNGGGFGALATGQQTIATALTTITALLRQIERCACQSATLLLGAPWNAATSSGSACENAASDPVTLTYDVRTVGLSSFSAWGAVRNNEITVLANGWANGLGVANTVYTTGDTRVQLIGPRWFAVNLGIGDFFEVGIRSSLPDAQYRFGGQVGYTHHFFVPAQAWIELYATGVEGINDPASLNLSLGVADCTPVEPPPVWEPTNRCLEGGGPFEETITFDPAFWDMQYTFAGRTYYAYSQSINSAYLNIVADGEFEVLEPLDSARYCISMDYEGEASVFLEHEISQVDTGIGTPGGTTLLTYKGQTSRTFDRQNAPPSYTLGHRLWLSVETGTPLPTVYVYMSGRLAV